MSPLKVLHDTENIASRSGRFNTLERPSGAHWIGGWVDPRAGLDDVQK
jgi:hypothetical protein